MNYDTNSVNEGITIAVIDGIPSKASVFFRRVIDVKISE